MIRAIEKYRAAINKQREILADWTTYEHELDCYWQRPTHGVLYDFESTTATYHHNLDVAEMRLEHIAAHGNAVDISDTQLGHDLLCVSDARRTGNPKGDKLCIRANLLKFDFYERFGRMPDASTSKLTIPRILAPRQHVPIADLALDIHIPVYEPVVFALFPDKADAMLYRLAVQ